jgi:hypothetical protein
LAQAGPRYGPPRNACNRHTVTKAQNALHRLLHRFRNAVSARECRSDRCCSLGLGNDQHARIEQAKRIQGRLGRLEGSGKQWRALADLTCANRRRHDGPQEDVDANGSVGQAVTVGPQTRRRSRRLRCSFLIGPLPHLRIRPAVPVLQRAHQLFASGVPLLDRGRERSLVLDAVLRVIDE